jgi:hypothetical protein
MLDSTDIVPLERRAHRRIAFRGPVAVDGHPGSCNDLSLGGIGLVTGHDLGLGHSVSVRLRLPDGGRVSADAEVVRASGGSVGVRFTKLDQSSLAALISYVGAGVPAPVFDA